MKTVKPEKPTIVTPAHAAAELLRRRRARNSLVEYARSIDIPGKEAGDDPEQEIFKPVETSVARHHQVIMEAVQRTIDPEHPEYEPNGRLMVFAPPGSAKSSYCSVVTPVWALSKWPDYQIILTSYGTRLAEKQSSKCRALARDARQSAIWEDRPTLDKSQRSKSEWALTNGSSFMAGGILSGITGHRADGIIIDDPVQGSEAAGSATIQDKTEEEYQSSIVTRLKPHGWIILIQTRWNQNDLAGRILPEDYDGRSGWVDCRDGQRWYVLNIPAEAEHADDPVGRQPGEFLWPEWFSERHWLIHKNNPRARATWASLYQQRPGASEGIDFQREWFNWYDPDTPPGQPGGLPANLTLYGASDLASSKPEAGEKRDFTEHGVVGVAANFDLWFVDWWFGQEDADKYISAWAALAMRHKPRMWWHEGGPIGATLTPMFKQTMREKKFYVSMDRLASLKNKTIKLQAFQQRAAMRTVWLPKNRSWATRLVDQLCMFPNGRHDDAADVCGLLARGIDKMINPVLSSVEKPRVLKPFTQEWFEYEEKPQSRIRYT